MSRRLLVVVASIGVAISALAHGQSGGTYSINFYAITSGGNTLRGRCFMLTGSVGQVEPGYSSGGIYAVYSGYQFPVQISANTGDEIFFDGFEGCR